MANKALSSLGVSAAASAVAGSSGEQIPNSAIDANGSTYVLIPTSGDITAQWLKVDLGAAYLIYKYRITFVNSSWTPTSWRIESSVDNVVWISRHYKASWTNTDLDSTTLALFQPTTARYWRVRPLSAPGSGMGPVSFELDDATGGTVEDDPDDAASGGYTGELNDNLALSSLGATATHNRSNHQGTVAGNAIDGNDGSYSLIQNPTGQWLRVDLGAAHFMGGYQVEWINSSWYSADYYIESSTDDSTWVERHHATGQTDAGTSGATAFNGSGASARYWRLRNVTAPGEGMGPTTFALHEGVEPAAPPSPSPKFRTNVLYPLDGSSSSVTVTLPGEIEDGEVLLFVAALNPARTMSPGGGNLPSGWAALSTTGNDQPFHVFWKRWSTGNPTSYTFTFAASLTGVAQLLVYRRTGTSGNPIVDYVPSLSQVTASPATSSFNPTDWTGDATTRLVLVYAAAGNQPRTVSTSPSSSTLVAQQLHVANQGSMQVWDKENASKTSVAAHTAVYDTSSTSHAAAILLVAPEPSTDIEGSASIDAAGAVTGAGTVLPGSTGTVAVTATIVGVANVQLGGTATAEATVTLNGAVAIATSAAGQPLTATATITGSLARVTLAAADPLLASAEVDGDGMFAITGAAGIIATFDFDLLAGVIMFAEGDIYAFGELENVLFAQVRRKGAGVLAALAETTLDGRVRYASTASVTAMAEIAKAVGGRERRDAPTLLAQAVATLAGRSGPGGHAVVFPSAVMTGALLQGTTGATDITARGKIEDFAPGAVVYRIVSASLFGGASMNGTARRDTASSGAVTASVGMIGKGGLLQRVESVPLASGAVELTGALIAIGGAGALSVPVVLVGAALRTIYESRHLHVDVTATATGRRETFAVSGLEGAGVNVVATGGYEHRASASIMASADVSGPNGGYLVKGAAVLAVSATATLGNVLIGSSAHLTATGTLEGNAPLTRLAAAALVGTATVTAAGGYVKPAAASIAARATVVLGANIALGASGSVTVFGLVLATVAPFQLGEGALVASADVAESGAIRLLGSRIFIHAEAFVWPRGGFPIDGAASVTCGAAVMAAAA